MKRARVLFTVLILAMLLLISVSVSAALPKDGVYEKRDGSGRVTAKMYVLTLGGRGASGPGQRSMASAAGAPYIAMEALDDGGAVTESATTSYSWKTPTAGAGETGLRLTGENLRNSLEISKKFTPEKISAAFGGQVNFSFRDEGEALVTHCSPALDGNYTRYGDAMGTYPLSMFLYAYERSYNMKSFYDKTVPFHTFSLNNYETTPYFGDYYCLNVWDPNRPAPMEVMAEKGFHIVMEHRPQHDFYFLFVKDDYHGDPSWVGSAWGSFTGSAMTSTNALYLHRHLTLSAPEIVEHPNTFIRMTDFFCGEGPAAVTTNVLSVLLEENGELRELATAGVDDTGAIRLRKRMGRASIKGEGVRIRALPNTSCEILGEKDNGCPLTVKGFVKQTGEKYNAFTWARVVLDDGTEGYVSGQFVHDIQ